MVGRERDWLFGWLFGWLVSLAFSSLFRWDGQGLVYVSYNNKEQLYVLPHWIRSCILHLLSSPECTDTLPINAKGQISGMVATKLGGGGGELGGMEGEEGVRLFFLITVMTRPSIEPRTSRARSGSFCYLAMEAVLADRSPLTWSNDITFHLSPRLCPSTAGCSPPSVPSIVLCLLLSCYKCFPPSLLCRLAIFYLVVPFISFLSLDATLYSVWSTYCPSFFRYVRPISSFVSVCK